MGIASFGLIPLLDLTLQPDMDHAIGLGTVYGRFGHLQEAAQLANCNRFSGKSNAHHFDGWTVEAATYDLRSRLKMVMG